MCMWRTLVLPLYHDKRCPELAQFMYDVILAFAEADIQGLLTFCLNFDNFPRPIP